MRRPSLLLVCSILLVAAPTSATSYVPVPDKDLVRQAPSIVVVTVHASGSPARSGRPVTEYRVEVEESLKGAVPAGRSLTVRVPGGVGAGGRGLKIWGAPRFVPGERALLFLSPNQDGTYSILHLMLGAFHEVKAGDRRLALRDLSEAREVSLPGVPAAKEGARDFDRFRRWIAAELRGEKNDADYFAADKFAPLLGFDGNPVRWFDFDSGGHVSWRAHSTGQVGVPGGGYAEFQTALQAWTNDPDTPIDYRYDGTTAADGGLTGSDDVNTILFNDPNGEVTPFSCGSGGVLAIGGPYYLIATTDFMGTLYHEAVEADIVVNNGLSCYFGAGPNANLVAAEIFAHELGHTLGLGHSNESDALMRANVHNDGRGASLSDDDRDGIRAFYNPEPPPPTALYTVTPCRLVDTRFGNGPSLASGLTRSFPAFPCGVPDTARAIVANVTIVNPTTAGHLTLYPSGRPLPATSTLNFSAGQIRSNNSILLLSTDGWFTAYAVLAGPGLVDVLVDVSGYFE